jgi:D-erythrulose 1-phosphate 3-epimerase
MTAFRLGINTCFAVKRWPEPEQWATIVREELGLNLVQHSLDLVDIGASDEILQAQAQAVRALCHEKGLTLDSTFTGLAAYSSNMLLDPRPEVRQHWEAWFGRAITFTAAAGAAIVGGHVGAFAVSEWRDQERRAVRWNELKQRLQRLAARAKDEGLAEIYVENLAAAREPATMAQIDDLLTTGDARRVPILLCLDVGHQCVPGTTGRDRDPYAWLEAYGSRLGAVHLQQSDAVADHHWPFTAAHNAEGRIDADRVLAALEAGGATDVTLLLEIIPSFEQDDDVVFAELVESARYWQAALEEYALRAAASDSRS